MAIHPILVADDLEDKDPFAKKRSLVIQRLASDLSVLLQTSTDLLFVHPIKDFLGKKISGDELKAVCKRDYEKYRSQMHNFQRPGKLHIKMGSPIREIVRHIDAIHAEALVLGTKPHSNMERFFLGSVAEEVVRATKRPVIIAGPQFQKAEYHLSENKKLKFLVVTDLTKKCRSVETYAVSLAKKLGAQVHFYYSLLDTLQTAQSFAYGSGDLLPTFTTLLEDIKKDAEQTIDKKLTRLREKGIDCQFHVENEKAPLAEAALQYANLSDVQLIFMGHSGHSGFVSSILGTNLRAMIAGASVPVVVIS